MLSIFYSTLVKGNSGSIVYAVDAYDDILYPLGMLIGVSKRKPECGTTVYQAVPLAPNLASIEERHELFVSGLKSLSVHCDHSSTLDREFRAENAAKMAKQLTARPQKSSARPPSSAVSHNRTLSGVQETNEGSRRNMHDSGIDSSYT